ncbi:hypothetical protein ACFWNQ_15110 [Streptomyces virginiae]|uniref:hypothetical protein n=1 Tax=Streptomyces virginiae TaxID=1961 RepID=UPI00365506F0
MKIRADVAEMLRDGLTNQQVARRAHISQQTAAIARAALGLPKSKPGQKRQASLEQALRDRSRVVDAGHWEWAGPRSNGLAVVHFDGRRYTACRAAFVIHHQRAPIGEVRPGCGRAGCMAPAHMDDRPARERNNATFVALFGGAA